MPRASCNQCAGVNQVCNGRAKHVQKKLLAVLYDAEGKITKTPIVGLTENSISWGKIAMVLGV